MLFRSCYLFSRHAACVGHYDRDHRSLIPDGARVRGTGSGIIHLDVECGVLECCIRQPETELEAGLDVFLVKSAVVNVCAFGKVTLWRVEIVGLRHVGIYDGVVGDLLGNCVWKLSGRRLFTIEELNKCGA